MFIKQVFGWTFLQQQGYVYIVFRANNIKYIKSSSVERLDGKFDIALIGRKGSILYLSTFRIQNKIESSKAHVKHNNIEIS